MKFSWDNLHPSLKEENFLAYQLRATSYKNDERRSFNSDEGFNPESVVKFNIPLIQELLETPETKINKPLYVIESIEAAENLKKTKIEIAQKISKNKKELFIHKNRMF